MAPYISSITTNVREEGLVEEILGSISCIFDIYILTL